MSTTSKTPDWEKNYSRFRKDLQKFDTDRMEYLLDLYKVFPQEHAMQIKAIKDELKLRKTSLGRELL